MARLAAGLGAGSEGYATQGARASGILVSSFLQTEFGWVQGESPDAMRGEPPVRKI